MSVLALEGLRPWILQRLTAVYLAVYIVYFTIYWLIAGTPDYQGWNIWLSQIINQITLGLFFLSLLLHAWIGVRDILIDYIKPLVLRITLYYLVALSLFGASLWLVKILLMVN